MQTKVIEIRDVRTFIPAVAVKLSPNGPEDAYLLHRVGFRGEDNHVILIHLAACKANYDPYGWEGSARTMGEAHRYLINHWDKVKSGDVVDVAFILGETEAPVPSERKP